MNDPATVHIVRLVQQGAGLYLCVPKRVCVALALHAGDRLICDHDAEQVFLKRLPLEAFLPLRRGPALRVDRLPPGTMKPTTAR